MTRRASAWSTRVVTEVQRLAARRHVRFTFKAIQELALLDAPLDEEDALEILSTLSTRDLVGRIAARSTPEWLYVFKPVVSGRVLYVKLIVRCDCVVVSFHEDEDDDPSHEA